ncbi:MAG: Holliday junction branch migration protein RuvA [Clostridia bacterium]|nr:Holliday junction branch migration protein RuvA [Clostridia bacterium]
MFYSLTGKVVFADATSIAVDCHGVAYRCFATMNTLKRTAQTGATVTLYTYLAVREDAMELYGFADTEELDFFKLLIGVSGVGPKAALAILSELTPAQLSMSIASGDVKSITRANGVGPKIAQRVVLELKDKIAKNVPAGVSSAQLESIATTAQPGSASAEAVSALVALGYAQTEAARAVARLDISLSVEEMIKLALKELMRGV